MIPVRKTTVGYCVYMVPIILTFVDVGRRISRAVSQYVGCGNNSCDCYMPVIDNDLQIWSDGISRSSFELAKKRGVHYQVIDHKLYRQQDCLFTARWARLYSLIQCDFLLVTGVVGWSISCRK